MFLHAAGAQTMGWVARFCPDACLTLLHADVLPCVMGVLEEQAELSVIRSAFHALKWLLTSGGKSLWIEDDEDAEPLYSGEVCALH